jgi:hypothetical protein
LSFYTLPITFMNKILDFFQLCSFCDLEASCRAGCMEEMLQHVPYVDNPKSCS